MIRAVRLLDRFPTLHIDTMASTWPRATPPEAHSFVVIPPMCSVNEQAARILLA